MMSAILDERNGSITRRRENAATTGRQIRKHCASSLIGCFRTRCLRATGRRLEIAGNDGGIGEQLLLYPGQIATDDAAGKHT